MNYNQYAASIAANLVGNVVANLAYTTVDEYAQKAIDKTAEFLNRGNDGTIIKTTPFVASDPNLVNNKQPILENNSEFNRLWSDKLASMSGEVQPFGNYMGYRTVAGISQLMPIPTHNPHTGVQDPVVLHDNDVFHVNDEEADETVRNITRHQYEQLQSEVEQVLCGQFRILSKSEQELYGGDYSRKVNRNNA